MHEYIKTNRDLIGLYSIRRQRLNKVSETSAMWFMMTIDNTERIRTARCQKKIVSLHRIFHHGEHHVASVRIKLIPCSKKDCVSIVDRAA